MKTLARIPALALIGVAALVLSACSDTADTAEGTGSSSADDPISIVASTSIWADVAESVVDTEEVEVTAIVEGNDADPHSFEPAAADMARAAEADIIVVGGGGYDAWLYKSQDEAKVVHALPLTSHDHDHDHGAEAHGHSSEAHAHNAVQAIDGNEHIWYDTAAVTRVAEDIAAKIQEINPDAPADTAALTNELNELQERLHALPKLRVAQSEPIADYLLAHSEVTEVTPDGYRAASLSHSEPAAADLAEFLELIESGELDLLLYNPQTQTDLTQRVRTAAEDAGIPVVEIFETPEADEDFLTFFRTAVDRLEQTAQEVTAADENSTEQAS